MKFGKSYEEDKNSPSAGGADFMKYFKDGDTTFRIVEEPKDWTSYWEHFNPGGHSFPCTTDRSSCPGCTSDNEKMKKPSKKIAFNVLEGEQVNVYKVPKTVADKLDNRAQRNDTIMDRDYTISRISSKNSDGSTKTDYDIEGQEKRPVDVSKLKLRNIEQMLQDAYDDSWGDSDKTIQSKANSKYQQDSDKLQAKLADEQKRQLEAQDDEPPFDRGNTYDEKDLRALNREELLNVIVKEGMTPPEKFMQPNELVDWMMEN